VTSPVSAAALLLGWAPPISDLLAGAHRERFFVESVSRQPGTPHRSLPGRWLVSLRATSLGPEVDAWIVVIEQFATSMCR
jgi:hypothetical protein